MPYSTDFQQSPPPHAMCIAGRQWVTLKVAEKTLGVAMHVSEYYNLGRLQPTLDFVDVDTVMDTPVYIDPGNLKKLSDDWAVQCAEMLGTFFDSVVQSLSMGDDRRVRELLVRLQEPNETHFGLSKGKSRGRALGPDLVNKICRNLHASRAARSGLLEDLEDTALFIKNIGRDIVSDITTCVIRGMLTSYTQSMAKMHDIPLVDEVYSGLAWDPVRREWDDSPTSLPVADGKPLLLVPKVIVRYDLLATKQDFFRNHLAPAILADESDRPTGKLVRAAKDAVRELKQKSAEGADEEPEVDLVELAEERVEVFRAYKDEKRAKPIKPLTHAQLSKVTGTDPVDFDELLDNVLKIPPGSQHASRCHDAIEALFTALFYPALTNPVKEHPVDDGRKRVDITYTNRDRRGFFDWLTRQGYLCPYVFFECKNYSSDLGNPELDQICGRFTPLRGKVGIIICRSFVEKGRFLQRCRDAARGHRGYVLFLDDGDLRLLVDEVKKALGPRLGPDGRVVRNKPKPAEFRLLHEKFRDLVS
ncbi:hypothetical protein [Streptomyces hainanensis]|uniref:Restriction endonuclease type IV Mrr domain-containing protein n=1 Tax=Streptomyces hainanensis TaxID=402648 RepID=A0A4R4SNW2_9ACTN|nr:hypothetical protein [Streptomyces hainanensis]TDC65527.1 hypothetical protein E1283_30585 [Streptomyces hainanensis]